MPGQRRLHRRQRGFQIADFTDHDHVGILPYDPLQQPVERQLDLRLHLNLIDAAQMVFDRVLDRDDLPADRIQCQQRRVKRRRLPAAGRSGDQHDPILAVQ